MRTNYTVEVINAVKHDLKKLGKNVQRSAIRAMAMLREGAYPDGCVKIVGTKNGYRVKIEHDYRLFYAVNEKRKIITVLGLMHRGQAYSKYFQKRLKNVRS